MKTISLSALAIVLALSAPAVAQTASGTSTQGNAQSPSSQQNTQNNQGPDHQKNVLTINKLKQDLQNAGFTDVQILSDSFVVQAKDKQGNPTIMSLSPSGVFAISEISQQRQAKASNSTSGSSGAQTR